MIFDNIRNNRLYHNTHPLFRKAFDFLRTTDLENIALGKHLIEGDALFAIVMEYDTQEAVHCKIETHKKYIDLQYMIAGEEFIGIAALEDQIPINPYNKEGDFTFYDVNNLPKIPLKTGHFAIFYPDDIHQTMIQIEAPQSLRKVVVKISKDQH
jgi:YhcH/YjgK/YiaL family protein